MYAHVKNIVGRCFNHLRQLRSVRRSLSTDARRTQLLSSPSWLLQRLFIRRLYIQESRAVSRWCWTTLPSSTMESSTTSPRFFSTFFTGCRCPSGYCSRWQPLPSTVSATLALALQQRLRPSNRLLWLCSAPISHTKRYVRSSHGHPPSSADGVFTLQLQLSGTPPHSIYALHQLADTNSEKSFKPSSSVRNMRLNLSTSAEESWMNWTELNWTELKLLNMNCSGMSSAFPQTLVNRFVDQVLADQFGEI